MKVTVGSVTTSAPSWAKFAVTVVVASPASTSQTSVPEQPAPDQPTKVEWPEGTADSVTVWPSVKKPTQTAPQSSPPGALTTPPAPDPAFFTLTACWAVK